jgi:hypothetical protein
MLAGRPFERRSRSSSVCGRHDLCRAWRGVDWRAASRKWQFLAGEAEVVLKGGEKSGAMVWRFDFTTGSSAAVLVGRVCGLASSSPPSWTLPEGELLRRGDSVAFPPGGCAFTHVHQVPGIRRIIEGGIRIHTQGRSTAYGPGGAWFESGVEPVFAQAAADRPSRFIRLKILPRTPSW